MGTHPIFESDFDCLTEMSKRAPGSTLTQDNWDNDEKNEEQGNWTKAKESTLKQRVIMKAKRRGVTTSDSASKGIGSAFGGFGAKMANTKPAAGFSFEATSKKEDKKEEEVKNDKMVKTSDDEVIRLNKSLLEWCKAHLEKDPVCDFRPVFDDYKKHMDKIDKMYGHKWVDIATPSNASEENKNGTSEPEVKKPSFSFGKTDKKETSKPSFSFGATSSEKKNDETPKPLFSFGKTESEEKKDPPKFSFGSGSSDQSKDAAPKFSFGSKSDDKKDEKDEPAKPAGGFFANLGGSKPASSGFSFGSSSSGTSSAAFTFAPTATGSAAASTTAPSTKEDEEYVPPVAETKEFDDAKDALYQKKSKIFYLKDGNYKEIGVGLLFVKPLENDKASILVRADNTLGNILLNVAIPPSPAPVKQGKNNCLLPVVPNPPIEGVEGAVPLLIRVKTSDDADELIEIIKSKQS